MNIDECISPDYDADYFALMRDSIVGQRAIKSMGEVYLLRRAAMVGPEYDDEYEAYKHQADYLPVVRRTRTGLIGRAFTKVPEYTGDFERDELDLEGLNFNRFLRWILGEILAVKYCGILVDVNEETPVFVRYNAEDILDWHFDRGELRYLSLRENETTVSGGVRETTYGIRVWEFDEAGDAFSILHTKSDQNGWVESDPVYPVGVSGKLGFIPFKFVGGLGSKDSVLGPLAELALTYYDISAQYRWAQTKVGSPTFVIEWDANTNPNDAKEFLEMSGGESGIKIGSGHALQLMGAKASYVEVSGAGLSLFRDDLHGIKSQMIAAGARALADTQTTNLATDTVRIQNSGESSILAETVGGMEADLNDALMMMSLISGQDAGEIQMSRDFFSEGVSAQDLAILVAGWQGDAWPRDIIFDALRRGDWTNATDEELQDKIEGLI